ncbi:MAG: hypothetical protein A2849_00310 [Candidatus Taylorbacteria bacterium RIFCSPHIGHO2_01_FULL_51_15]|uniref:Uncharacterized protein n=1 Tax=Candidatus Taylorbacteria bacterium RIFCSPHIGHO2_01_FULL_51_15 TaxID=1802304 RepID=A0A1G2MC68_9BACT|nr:MAG: hypothetical protein A2849_00310 [Candidatus Taylorbacteria bacterium RIFCSPHIGHO2_01_FULL_51_15]
MLEHTGVWREALKWEMFAEGPAYSAPAVRKFAILYLEVLPEEIRGEFVRVHSINELLCFIYMHSVHKDRGVCGLMTAETSSTLTYKSTFFKPKTSLIQNDTEMKWRSHAQ